MEGFHQYSSHSRPILRTVTGLNVRADTKSSAASGGILHYSNQQQQPHAQSLSERHAAAVLGLRYLSFPNAPIAECYAAHALSVSSP